MVIQKAKIETDKNNSAVKGAIDTQKKLENWKSSPLSKIFLKILWQFDYIDMKLKAGATWWCFFSFFQTWFWVSKQFTEPAEDLKIW